MDDSPEPKTVPCPTCAEVETNGCQCDLCRQEDEAIQMAIDAAKQYEKFPAIDGATDLGKGMP